MNVPTVPSVPASAEPGHRRDDTDAGTCKPSRDRDYKNRQRDHRDDRDAKIPTHSKAETLIERGPGGNA